MEAAIRLIRVQGEPDVGALEAAEAIAITFSVGHGSELTVFGVRFSDGDFTTCAFGEIPALVSRRAKEVTQQWAQGHLEIPFIAAQLDDSAIA